jgi:hypothetical protein
MFLVDKEGRLKSSVGIVKGTKKEPLVLEDGIFVMQDNVAIEFGMPPAYSENEWVNKLAKSYSMLEEWLPEEYRLHITPSALFPDEELKTDEACQFGCDPDWNAWTKAVNVPPRATATNYRSCGGHVHIGHIEGTTTEFLLRYMGKINTIRMCDGYLGVPSIILDNTPESRSRRELYGKAGCFRETDYGVEYRTLSNFWLKNEAAQRFVYRATQDIIHHMDDHYIDCAKWVGYRGKGIQEIINKGDVDTAQVFVQKELMEKCGFSKNTKEAFFEAERELV